MINQCAAIARPRSLPDLCHRLLPPRCCLCGERGLAPAVDLCEPCLHGLAPPFGSAGIPGTCVEFVTAAFAYEYPVDHLVRALKFGGERACARVLGIVLAAAVRESAAALPEVLVPLPLHPGRLRERGFNQAAELARHAGRALGLRLNSRCLERTRATREQSGLALYDRHHNIRGAFALTSLPRASHVALVDDVLTTGSTAAEAARVLRAGGVRRVDVWVAARVTPRRDSPALRR